MKFKIISILFIFVFINTAISQDKDTNYVYTFPDVTQKAEYIGGFDSLFAFMNRNLKYPQTPDGHKVEGKVYVQFIIEKDGSISNPEILKDANKYINNEVIKYVKTLPNFKPARINNKPVRSYFIYPFSFVVD